ncbi:MAG: SDR family oxidoreductase [Eubacteriales bacterium]|nr:SDR family oxidoreductase [Eubacteriales bacterium]
MQKTILITGCSTGLGNTAAKTFARNGWNVIATMRRPVNSLEKEFPERIKVVRLDVTEPQTIYDAIHKGIKQFGEINAVVNNAGYGFGAIFEATPMEDIRAIFETNVFGVINVLQAAIPYFRTQGGGTIVNVSSSIGIVAAPLRAVYAATKFAVEGLTESLFYELESQNIFIRLVEPGFMTTTNFMTSPAARHADKDIPVPESYKLYHTSFMAVQDAPPSGVADVNHVAEQIYLAACDKSTKLRYPAGPDAERLINIRWSKPDIEYMEEMCHFMGQTSWRNAIQKNQ